MTTSQSTQARTFRTGTHPSTGTIHRTANDVSRGSSCNNRIGARTVNLVQVTGRTAVELLDLPESRRCSKCFSVARLTQIAEEEG